MGGIAMTADGANVYATIKNGGIGTYLYKSSMNNFFGCDITGYHTVNSLTRGNANSAGFIIGRGNTTLDPTGNGYFNSGIYYQDGTYQNTSIKDDVYITPNPAFAVVSVMRDISNVTGFPDMVCNATGQYLLARTYNGTQFFLSSNYGQTFATTGISYSSSYGHAISGSGKYVVIATDMSWNISSDFGATFTSTVPVAGVYVGNNIGVSYSGQYMVFATGSIAYTSSNYGVSFTGVSISQNYNTIAISSDGKYITIVSSSIGYMYSTNYGASYRYITNSVFVTGTQIYRMAISATGRYMFATSNNGIFVSSDFGTTWTKQLTVNCYSVKCCDSAQYVIAASTSTGLLYYSVNYGQTFTSVSSPYFNATYNPCNQVAISADGYHFYAITNNPSSTTKYILVDFFSGPVSIANNSFDVSMNNNLILSGRIYVGTPAVNANMALNGNISTMNPYVGIQFQDGSFKNTAMTYTYPCQIMPYAGTGFNMNAGTSVSSYYIASSSNCKYVYCYGSTTSYRSSDYGVSFTALGTTAAKIAISETGQYVINCASSGTSVLYSSDFGATFSSLSYTFTAINTLAISYNGQYMTVCDQVGIIYYSPDYGITWYIQKQNSINNIGTSMVSMSGDGRIQVLYCPQWNGTWRAGVWISYDYGNKWTKSSATFAAFEVVLSFTGKYIYANTRSWIYYSHDFGATWTRSSLSTPTNMESRISCSGNGQYVMSWDNSNRVCVSYDFGLTFNILLSNSSLPYSGTAVSYAGDYMYIYDSGVSKLYRCYNGPQLQYDGATNKMYNITTSDLSLNGNLILSSTKYASIPAFSSDISLNGNINQSGNLTIGNYLNLTKNVVLSSASFATPTSGQLGYTVPTTIASGLFTTNTFAQLASTTSTVPVGVWLFTYTARFNVTTTATSTGYTVGVHTSSAASPSYGVMQTTESMTINTGIPSIRISGMAVITVTTAATYYLNGSITFSAGAVDYNGASFAATRIA
jgi:hypothetical protein